MYIKYDGVCDSFGNPLFPEINFYLKIQKDPF